MSQTPEPPPDPQKKNLDLIDLLPAKVSVMTSLATLYVRHARVSDWKHLESDDLTGLGRIAVRQLANRIADKNDCGPLTNDEFDNLDNADFDALAHAIAKQNDWGKLPVGTALEGLGQAVLAAKEQERGRHKKMLEEMRKSIGGSYAFLDKSTLEKLQGQVAGLADIRASLSDSEAIKKVLGLAGSSEERLIADLAGTHVSKEIMRSFERAAVPSQVFARATDVLESLSGKEALEKAMGLNGSSSGRLSRELAGIRVSEATDTLNRTSAAINIDMPPIYVPPRPESTPIGRAAIESAENSRLVAQRMDGLVAVVVGLNQTLVTEVLPSWIKQVEHDQNGAKESFDQAASGIRWTKWAVIASIVVTMLATWWQVSVARDIDRDNSVQQQKALDILREQLAMQQKFAEQQARESEKLRELLGSKSQATVAKK